MRDTAMNQYKVIAIDVAGLEDALNSLLSDGWDVRDILPTGAREFVIIAIRERERTVDVEGNR